MTLAPSHHYWRSPWVALAAAALLAAPSPAAAGLLGPMLQLVRPQIEHRLAKVCVEAAAGGNPDLELTLVKPCRQLARPTSQCLVEETDRTGRGLGVITELLAGRFGDDSEVVVKRCLARLFGLPADSLNDVPLRALARRFGTPTATDPCLRAPAPGHLEPSVATPHPSPTWGDGVQGLGWS